MTRPTSRYTRARTRVSQRDGADKPALAGAFGSAAALVVTRSAMLASWFGDVVISSLIGEIAARLQNSTPSPAIALLPGRHRLLRRRRGADRHRHGRSP